MLDERLLEDEQRIALLCLRLVHSRQHSRLHFLHLFDFAREAKADGGDLFDADAPAKPRYRSIFKAAPVNLAWEQTLAKKNPFKRLADLRDDVEEFEVVDELASAIQLADQYCYSNTFIYTQPGNGKVKIKEPKQQVALAVQKIDMFLR